MQVNDDTPQTFSLNRVLDSAVVVIGAAYGVQIEPNSLSGYVSRFILLVAMAGTVGGLLYLVVSLALRGL